MPRFYIITMTFLTAGNLCAVQREATTSLTATEVLETVQRVYNNLSDASAEFTQKVTFKYAKVEQSFSGSIQMKKGNKYRIESQEQTLVTDGRTVWAYSPVNNQVLIDSYKENAGGFSPEKFLVGLPKNFRATLVEESSSNSSHLTVLKLLPKSDAPKFVRSLKVWINNSDWSIRQVEYVDMNETRTVYSLKSIAFNTGISDDRFTFSPPEKAEVVDLRSAERQLLRR